MKDRFVVVGKRPKCVEKRRERASCVIGCDKSTVMLRVMLSQYCIISIAESCRNNVSSESIKLMGFG